MSPFVVYHDNGINFSYSFPSSTSSFCVLNFDFFTKYGAVDIEPNWDIYKNQVRGLSGYMGGPLRIVEKTPTAWPGQTDKSELGVSYEDADRILAMLVDEERKISEVKGKFPAGIVERLAERISGSEHKRMAPSCVEI